MFRGLVPKPGPSNIVTFLRARFLVQEVAEQAIESRVVSSLEQHGEVAGILPVMTLSQLRLHKRMKARARQRVCDGDANVIGLFCSQKLTRERS